MKKNILCFFVFFCTQICLQNSLFGQTPVKTVNNPSKQQTNSNVSFTPKKILAAIDQATAQGVKIAQIKMIEYKAKLLTTYQQSLEDALKELNSLRNPYYQYRVYLHAKKLEGVNLYHDYGSYITQYNDDVNTCVNGWCQVMAETGMPVLSEVASGGITFYRNTVAEERKKVKPNLWQKRPKYIHVGEIIKNAAELGFLMIDLDLAQRGDFAIQYYNKQRGDDAPSFAPQHISIVDKIIPWNDGMFELRDWHEGIEGEPFVYRTGTNMSSSFNNIFLPENVYYGFQNDRGKERPILGKNPNISQGYAYFGANIEKAEAIIKEINYIRGQIHTLQNLQADAVLNWQRK